MSLAIAKTIPTAAITSEKILMNPPRMLGDIASSEPDDSETIAISAEMNPAKAPHGKRLQTAAAMAMMEGMLKCACVCPVTINKALYVPGTHGNT